MSHAVRLILAVQANKTDLGDLGVKWLTVVNIYFYVIKSFF